MNDGPVRETYHNDLNLIIRQELGLYTIFAENDTFMPVQGNLITTRVQMDYSLICIEVERIVNTQLNQ